MNQEEFNDELLEEADSIGGEPEGGSGASRLTGFVKKAAALLVLLAFIAFSLLDLTSLFSSRLDFLDQNKELMEDEIVQQCRPAVVSVEAGPRRGTGFNISPSGTIITNRHIVAGAETVIIQFGDGRKFYTGQHQSVPDADIAVVRLEGDVSGLPVIELNREEPVKSGDTVTIIGNPLGFEKISQRGSVGGFHRRAGSSSPVFDVAVPINPGNSGSPVINSRAQAVGIVYASATMEIDGQKAARALAYPVQVLPE